MANNPFERFRRSFESKYGPGLEGRIAARFAGQTMKATADMFRNEQDPYGEPWAPLKRERTRNKRARNNKRNRQRNQRQRILQDKGILSASFSAQVNGSEIRWGTSVRYAKFHQGGTRWMPARKVLPDKRGLPPKLKQKLDNITRSELSRGGNNSRR